MKSKVRDIWILVQHREGAIEEATFGLIDEAHSILSDLGGEGAVTAVAMGSGLKADLKGLGVYGADKVLYLDSEIFSHYQGELFSKLLHNLAKEHNPSFIFMAQTPEMADLSARLAALLETGLVTHAIDFTIGEHGEAIAVRPISNGYLFEEISFYCQGPPIISFLPSVLNTPEPDIMARVEILTEPLHESLDDLKTRVVEIIKADPEASRLEEADIIVSGGRGVGKNESFNIIKELARTIGGAVGGTRPVIDWQTLSFERQIGQTGKTVAPRLIFACGISGANEFTAGMERSQRVIAINTDPRARIFRFADMGVIGDVHEILPILIARLKEIKESK
ncbi:MAG: electron transfer flavoprotein subunit alpha/FixB family protein [Thermodesulfobacteriota bacterium]|nr:electron transfer flavoprotein subunit alpha/FixB family protein [Thermodesulfobacteriota bacterium]